MKNNRPSTRRERNYTFRRLTYDTLIVSKSVELITFTKRDYSAKETAKVAGLLMARNFDEFFFKQLRLASEGRNAACAYRYDDDVFVTDLAIQNWAPNANAAISKRNRTRISKLVGHIVAKPPAPFSDDEAIRVITPLVSASIDCLTQCLQQMRASLTGKSTFYIRRLNGILRKLQLRPLIVPTS